MNEIFMSCCACGKSLSKYRLQQWIKRNYQFLVEKNDQTYKEIKKLSKEKRVAALGFGNTLNYAEHAIKNIKSCFSKEFSRGANYQ